MPKKIDHAQYRLALAKQASALFSEYGYSGLGMRTIATHLGISKSALYHYFPSKQALFHACTQLMTQTNESNCKPLALSQVTQSDKIHQLFTHFKQLETSFPGELSLVLDYLRGNNSQQIAENTTMQHANHFYQNLVEQFIEQKHCKPVLCLLMGTLLMRYFDGGTTRFEHIEKWLINSLAP